MREKLRFTTHRQTSTFHNPLLGNRLDTQDLEIRKDPLTDRQSIFNPRLQDKAAVFFGPTDAALIERLARASEPSCFLCGERWKQTTPMYPEELVPGGRIQVGDAVLFPNLFPLSQLHAVIRVGRDDARIGFAAKQIRDAQFHPEWGPRGARDPLCLVSIFMRLGAPPENAMAARSSSQEPTTLPRRHSSAISARLKS